MSGRFSADSFEVGTQSENTSNMSGAVSVGS